MRRVLPWTVMRRTDSEVVSWLRSSSQLRSSSTARAMAPPARSEGRPARRKPARVPEPASGDMGDALGQGGQLSGGAGLRHRQVEGEEVEVGGVELEVAQGAPREEEVRKRRAAAGDGALQPLHHVAGERERALHQAAAAGEGGLTLLLERGEVADAGRPEQQLGLS